MMKQNPKNRHCRFYRPHCHPTNPLSRTLCYSTTNNIFPTSQVLACFLPTTNFLKAKNFYKLPFKLEDPLKIYKKSQIISSFFQPYEGCWFTLNRGQPKNLAPKQFNGWCTTSEYIVFEILGLGPTVQQTGSIFQ